MAWVPEWNAYGMFFFVFVLFILVSFFAIIYYIFDNFADSFISFAPSSYQATLTDYKNAIDSTANQISEGLKLLFYIVLGITILSTAFSPSNLFTMVEHFLFLIIISSILTYVFGVIYNSFVTEYSTTPSNPYMQTLYSKILNAITDFSIVFTNFNLILLGNLIAIVINVLMPKYGGGRVSQFYTGGTSGLGGTYE